MLDPLKIGFQHLGEEVGSSKQHNQEGIQGTDTKHSVRMKLKHSGIAEQVNKTGGYCLDRCPILTCLAEGEDEAEALGWDGLNWAALCSMSFLCLCEPVWCSFPVISFLLFLF